MPHHRRSNHMEYRNLQVEFSLPCPHCKVTGVRRYTTFITTVVAWWLRNNPSSPHGPGEQIVYKVNLPLTDTLARRTRSGQHFSQNSLPMDIPISNHGQAWPYHRKDRSFSTPCSLASSLFNLWLNSKMWLGVMQINHYGYHSTTMVTVCGNSKEC